jgi:hypothetical protein
MSDTRVPFLLLVAWAMLACAGCASTRIVNDWKNPAYTQPVFKKVMVFGVTKQVSIRRTFEDEFVGQLRAAGVAAVPSYIVMPEDGQASEEAVRRAVEEVGADAAIVTRLVSAEQRTQVTPGYYQPMPALGFYGWYSNAWVGYYEPPQVYHYDVYISETSLYNVVKNEVVWSGTVQTTAPGEIKQEIADYARLMIKTMKDKKVL